MRPGLTLLGKFYSYDWVREQVRHLNAHTVSELEYQILTFCGQWLSGQKQFDIATSGTTGAPKSIQLTREQMALSAQLTGRALNLGPGYRALMCLSPNYIAGLMMLVRGIELQLELTVVEPASNPFASPHLSDTDRFDFTALVPLQLQTVLEAGPNFRDRLDGMKAILIGGSPVSVALEARLQDIAAPIYHTFGMTETATHIALRRLNGPDATEYYEVLPEVTVGVDDRGCLTIRSLLTQNQLLATNDLVELGSDQHFRWLGRIDNVINSGGVKIPAERVEHAIAEVLLDIRDRRFANTPFFVAGLPDARFGEIVVAIFEADPFSSDVTAQIQEALSSKLEKYELPKRFLFVDKLRRTTTGKIDRKGIILNLAANGRSKNDQSSIDRERR